MRPAIPAETGVKNVEHIFWYDENAVLSVDTYFNNTYDEAWLDDPFVR